MVDVSRSKLASELRHEDYYRPRFAETLTEELGDDLPYDAIVFGEPTAWGHELVTHFAAFADETRTKDEVGRLFNL